MRALRLWWLRLRRQLRRRVAEITGRLRRGEHAFSVATAILLGIAGGYVAICFRWMMDTAGLLVDLVQSGPWTPLAIVTLPAIGGLIAGLISLWAPEVRGSGVPEVMEAVARRGGAMRGRVLAAKALAATATIASGGSAGREGPIVHIGSSLGSWLGKLLQVSPRRMRSFVACGAAAGIAATFNAPIAGALFALEVVLGDLAVASLSPIVIASVVATVISRSHLGDRPAFDIPAFELISWTELGVYAVLGLFAALVMTAFIGAVEGLSGAFQRIKAVWLRPAVGGLVVGLLALFWPQVRGVSYQLTTEALFGELALGSALVLVLVKLLATSATLGSGGSGGITAPSLVIGACLGSAVGLGAATLLPNVAGPGAYALVGMGACLSAATHAPITAILLIFELTNDYRTIAPLMLACVLAVLVATVLRRTSIYTAKLERRGVRLHDGRDLSLLSSIEVGDVMDHEPEVMLDRTPFSEILPRLLGGHHDEMFVTNGAGSLMGTVSIGDVKALLGEAETLASLVVAADLINEELSYVVPSDSLEVAMHLFGRTHRDELPVVSDGTERRILGAVTRAMVIEAYNQRIFQIDLTGGFGSLMKSIQKGRTMEILGGVHLGEIDVPQHLVGKTLAEADLRRELSLEVVLIHTPMVDGSSLEGRPGRFPAPNVVLEEGDRLLVIGDPKKIEALW